MKLTDFEPNMAGGFLVFWCPACRGEHDHRIRVPIAPTVFHEHSWRPAGEFPATLTLTPSIDAGCWHGNLTNGELITIPPA